MRQSNHVIHFFLMSKGQNSSHSPKQLLSKASCMRKWCLPVESLEMVLSLATLSATSLCIESEGSGRDLTHSSLLKKYVHHRHFE